MVRKEVSLINEGNDFLVISCCAISLYVLRFLLRVFRMPFSCEGDLYNALKLVDVFNYGLVSDEYRSGMELG